MAKAITPAEIGTGKLAVLPECVFEIVNRLLATNVVDGRAVIKQDAIVHDLCELAIPRSQIFALGYLNFEAAYQDAGWNVEYWKPAYNESGSATFTFTAKA